MTYPSDYVGAVQQFWYGHTNVPTPADFEYAWKAVKAIAAGDGKLSDSERVCLLGKMCAIATPREVVEKVMAWDEHSEKPAALLAKVGVPDAVRRGTGAWIVYEGLTVALADGEIAVGEMGAVREAARSMEVSSDTVTTLHKIVLDEFVLRQHRISTLHGTISESFRFGK